MGLSRDEIHALKVIFDVVDVDNDGRIERRDVGRILRDAGFEPSPREVENIVDALDRNNSGEVSWNEFVDFFEHLPDRLYFTLKLRRAFIAADTDQSGFLSEREVVRVARELDLVPRPFSSDDIEDALRRCPSFNDGRASYHEVMDLLPWVD